MNAIATPVSETQRLADYLRGIGYPVLRVDPETKDETGVITMFDTNPDHEKGKERALLEVEVDFFTKGRGASKRVELSCVVRATRWYKNGRQAADGRYTCGDLSDLESDTDSQESVAVLVRDCLKLKRDEKVFDAKMIGLNGEVERLRIALREAEQARDAYKEGLRKQGK
jgi:hypothetical protein